MLASSTVLPIPGEAKAKVMPGRLYIHTRNNNNKINNNNKPLLCPIWILPERDVLGARKFGRWTKKKMEADLKKKKKKKRWKSNSSRFLLNLGQTFSGIGSAL